MAPREDLRGKVHEYLDAASAAAWRGVDLAILRAPEVRAGADGSSEVTVHAFEAAALPEPFVWYDLHVTRLPPADTGSKRSMFQSKAASDPHARVLVQHSRLSMRVLSGAPVPVSFPAEIAAGAARVGSRGLMFEVRGRTAKGVTVSKCAYLPADAGPPLIKTNLISRPQLRWADPSTETRVAVGFEPWGAGFEQYVVITALRDPATATPGSIPLPEWSGDLCRDGNVPSELKITRGHIGKIRFVGFNRAGESAFVDMFWPDPEARRERERQRKGLEEAPPLALSASSLVASSSSSASSSDAGSTRSSGSSGSSSSSDSGDASSSSSSSDSSSSSSSSS